MVEEALNSKLQKATFSGGCFWCTEAIFRRLKGVIFVEPGYSGGEKPNPTYEEVCAGNTGYAESVQVEFDPEIISYQELLKVFFALHDPTTLNRQGADVGSQYRSEIFYHNEDQKSEAEKFKTELNNSGNYVQPIVTLIEPFKNFYPAEQAHKDFYERNREYGYCRVVIDPKIQKLYKDFKEQLKP